MGERERERSPKTYTPNKSITVPALRLKRLRLYTRTTLVRLKSNKKAPAQCGALPATEQLGDIPLAATSALFRLLTY